MKSYYVITPNNNVRGPFASVKDARQHIPGSHYVNLADHVTDMKACCSNLSSVLPEAQRDAEIEHLESWVRDARDDADEAGYLIFSVAAE